jgi:hypothetical protein
VATVTDDRYRSLPTVTAAAKTSTIRDAARQLGVTRELVEGLIIGKQLKGYRATGTSGVVVALVDTKDLRRLMREGRP